MIKDAKKPSGSFSFGVPEAQKEFENRYRLLLHEYIKVRDAQDKVISTASQKMRNVMEDKIIYLLARQVYEDFDEILLLCANGYSTGAMKILRGMFERTVTVCYLQKHLDKIELYHKYYYVRRRKEMMAIAPEFPNAIPETAKEIIEREYAAVKHFFQVPVCQVCKTATCKVCKKTRDNFSWIRKDIVQMARETGNFGGVIYHGYYLPLQESHPTAQAITHRIAKASNGRWRYEEGPKSELDDVTLMAAHFLVIRAVEVLGLHFAMRTKGMMSKLWGEFIGIWRLKKSKPKGRIGNP